MKKPYMDTILGSSGRDFVLIIYFNFMALSVGFLKLIYSGRFSMTLNLHIGRRTYIQYNPT